MKVFSHRWYGVLLVVSVLAGILAATYALQNASSQSIHVSGLPAPVAGALAGFPLGATPNYGFISGVGSALTASMNDVPAGKLAYLCGWSVTGGGAAGRVGVITVGGLGSEFDYDGSVTLGGGTIAEESYSPCLPAASVGSVPSVSTGAAVLGANVTVQLWGYNAPVN